VHARAGRCDARAGRRAVPGDPRTSARPRCRSQRPRGRAVERRATDTPPSGPRDLDSQVRMSERIDVSIEHKHAPPEDGGRPHPNTCPECGSHYRDDELDDNLRVCPHCGHHFPVHARERIRQLTDEASFAEEAAELRSDDPLGFFDLRPYTERLAEAELATGLGEAMVIGRAAIEELPCELAVMEFGFM